MLIFIIPGLFVSCYRLVEGIKKDSLFQISVSLALIIMHSIAIFMIGLENIL